MDAAQLKRLHANISQHHGIVLRSHQGYKFHQIKQNGPNIAVQELPYCLVYDHLFRVVMCIILSASIKFSATVIHPRVAAHCTSPLIMWDLKWLSIFVFLVVVEKWIIFVLGLGYVVEITLPSGPAYRATVKI